jgi:hypothetical protein
VTYIYIYIYIYVVRRLKVKQKTILAKTDYISESISEIVYPLLLIEWHCNIAEYSYSNHDDHPHIHKQEELVHISFIDNNFYDNPVYKEKCTKIMFVPLRKGLREIREIVLTPLAVNNKKKKLEKCCCTRVRGFKPGRSRRIFSGEKILSMPSFGREVKPFAPCRRFAACKRTL